MKKNTAILLLHGFTGSPSQMAWLGQQLESEGFAVSIPTLCGHGSDPANLFGCRYQNWVRQTESALASLREAHQAVFVAGLSLGGVLALRLAALHAFQGVVSLAAPYSLPLWQEVSVRAGHLLVKWRRKKEGTDIKNKSALASVITYDRYPTRAAAEVFKLMREVRPIIPRITIPALIMHGRDDHAVPAQNAAVIYKRLKSRQKNLVILENSYHILSLDHDRELVFRKIIEFAETVIDSRATGAAKRSSEFLRGNL